MAGVADNILIKLLSSPVYKPMNVNTFGDWSLEAGDIISVETEDGTEQIPILDSSMTWKGSAETSISAGGSPQREVQKKAERQMYSAIGGLSARIEEEFGDDRDRLSAVESGIKDILYQDDDGNWRKGSAIYATLIDPNTGGIYDSIMGATIVYNSATGKYYSMAELTADVIELNGRVNLTGSLNVENGNIVASGNIYADGKTMRCTTSQATYADYERLRVNGTDYVETDITFIKGQAAVTVLAVRVR